jgi:hypothetical protein
VDAKDTLLLGKCGNGACGIFAEEAVSVAGDEAVAKLAQGAGDESEDASEEWPEAWDEAERLFYGVGAAVEALVWREGRGDEDDALGCGRCGEGGEKFFCERGLLGDEAELGGAVVLEEVADDAVAEGAYAVVEEDGVGFDLLALVIRHGVAETLILE